MEPELGPCLWVPTRTNAPTGPHYCCRQLSLMSSRVSDSMQLLQMALPSHLALPLSIYRRWETCQWPTSLQRERKRSVMEFSTIWSQHSPQTQHSESLRMVKHPPNRIQIKSFLDYFWWVLASVLSIMQATSERRAGKRQIKCVVQTHVSHAYKRATGVKAWLWIPCWLPLCPQKGIFLLQIDREC